MKVLPGAKPQNAIEFERKNSVSRCRFEEHAMFHETKTAEKADFNMKFGVVIQLLGKLLMFIVELLRNSTFIKCN